MPNTTALIKLYYRSIPQHMDRDSIEKRVFAPIDVGTSKFGKD